MNLMFLWLFRKNYGEDIFNIYEASRDFSANK